MMVPMTRAARLMTSMSSLKLPSPPAGPYQQVAAVLDGHDDERHGHQACGQQQRDGEAGAGGAA